MATNAHTEAPGGPHKGPFPPFNPETFASQLVWLTITFVALYLLVDRVMLPRVEGILKLRRDTIARDLAEAQQRKTEADEALAVYEKSLADARNRGQALAQQLREQQAGEADAARRTLDQSLNAQFTEAEKSIAKAKVAAMGNVRGIAAEAANAIVERMIGSAPARAAVDAAVADVLKG